MAATRTMARADKEATEFFDWIRYIQVEHRLLSFIDDRLRFCKEGMALISVGYRALTALD